MQHQLWFTALLNRFLGGIVSKMLIGAGIHPTDPAHPIPNYIAMEILVILGVLGVAFLVRRRLSIENPAKLQQTLELVVEFHRSLAEQIIGHGAERHVPILTTLGVFILLCNLLGLIPTLESPTAHIQVTLGCAFSVFIYYNVEGVRHHGVLGYLRTFCGPMMWIAIIMFPVEIISNLARLLSLSVRLYANMFAGELLEHVFTSLIPIAVPAVLMGLHVFVSFVQTYIFVLLPSVYISMAVAEEH